MRVLLYVSSLAGALGWRLPWRPVQPKGHQRSQERSIAAQEWPSLVAMVRPTVKAMAFTIYWRKFRWKNDWHRYIEVDKERHLYILHQNVLYKFSFSKLCQKTGVNGSAAEAAQTSDLWWPLGGPPPPDLWDSPCMDRSVGRPPDGPASPAGQTRARGAVLVR